MSKKTRNRKPKKVDVLKLSKSEKAHLLKEAKEKLRQKMVEARFWQSFAETERVTINGYKIDFEDDGLKGLACGELAGP
jgi:hypothetical protein